MRLFAGGQQTFEFTSQLYLDDSITDLVYGQAPYNSRGARNTRNANDGIYTAGGNSGAQLLLALSQEAQGYVGLFDWTAVDVTAARPGSAQDEGAHARKPCAEQDDGEVEPGH